VVKIGCDVQDSAVEYESMTRWTWQMGEKHICENQRDLRPFLRKLVPKTKN